MGGSGSLLRGRPPAFHLRQAERGSHRQRGEPHTQTHHPCFGTVFKTWRCGTCLSHQHAKIILMDLRTFAHIDSFVMGERCLRSVQIFTYTSRQGCAVTLHGLDRCECPARG